MKRPRHPLVIGIDLDNTLVCHDELLHLVACEEGLIEPALPKNKTMIRDAIRLLPDGENQWIRLQAMIYGPRMAGATWFDGVDAFLRHCARSRTRTLIVSHKTRFARLDGRQVDLRESALEWLKARGLFSGFALSPQEVFFESTRAEKIERIRSLHCTHFIDDLAEVFTEGAFPRETGKLLFAPCGATFTRPDVRAFASWRELDEFFFNDTDP